MTMSVQAQDNRSAPRTVDKGTAGNVDDGSRSSCGARRREAVADAMASHEGGAPDAAVDVGKEPLSGCSWAAADEPASDNDIAIEGDARGWHAARFYRSGCLLADRESSRSAGRFRFTSSRFRKTASEADVRKRGDAVGTTSGARYRLGWRAWSPPRSSRRLIGRPRVEPS